MRRRRAPLPPIAAASRRRDEKPRIGFLLLARQRDPHLDAVHRPAFTACALEALGVRDAAARRHPVHFARTDRLLRAHAVAMHDLASEEVGERGKADVRMRTHVDAARDRRRKIHRSHVVEEHERADHAPLGEGKDSADFEAAEVAAPLRDRELDRAQAWRTRLMGGGRGEDRRTQSSTRFGRSRRSSHQRKALPRGRSSHARKRFWRGAGRSSAISTSSPAASSRSHDRARDEASGRAGLHDRDLGVQGRQGHAFLARIAAFGVGHERDSMLAQLVRGKRGAQGRERVARACREDRLQRADLARAVAALIQRAFGHHAKDQVGLMRNQRLGERASVVRDAHIGLRVLRVGVKLAQEVKERRARQNGIERDRKARFIPFGDMLDARFEIAGGLQQSRPSSSSASPAGVRRGR